MAKNILVKLLADTSSFNRSMNALGRDPNISKFTGAVKTLGKVAIGSGVAVAGLALKGGFDRALNIQDAQAKLKGLGYGVKDIEKVTTSALNSVKGTAFSLDKAMTVSSTALAAGVKNGSELEKYLKNVGDAATIAGADMGEMGAIFNKIQANGKLQREELNQLADRGIPVLSWLSEEYGVTAEAMSKMITQGKVDSGTFQKVIAKNIGGAAQESGNTVRGAFANMRAAMSRAGEKIVGKYIPDIQNALVGITDFFDKNSAKFEEFFGRAASAIGTLVTALISSAKWIKENEKWTKPLGIAIGVLAGTMIALHYTYKTVISIKKTYLVVTKAIGAYMKIYQGVIMGTVRAIRGLHLVTRLQHLALKAKTLALKVAAGGTKLYTLAQIGLKGAVTATGLAFRRLGGFIKALNIQQKAQIALSKAHALASKALAVVQGVLNAVMAANPFVLIGIAVVALVAGIVLLWKKNEGFRDAVIGIWDKIKGAFSTAVDFIKGLFNSLLEGIKFLFSFSPLGIIIANWDTIKAAISTAVDFIKGIFNGGLKLIKKVWSYTPLAVIIANWDKIKGAFNTVVDKIKGFFNSAWNLVKQVWSYSPIAIIKNNWSKITGFFKGIPNTIKGYFNKARDFLKDAGKNIIEGLKDGASGLLKGLGKWFLNKVPLFIREPFKKALGIKSPSTEFQKYGQNLIQGLVKGASDIRPINKAMSKISSAVMQPLSPIISPTGSAIQPGSNVVIIQRLEVKNLGSDAETGRLIQKSLDDWQRLASGL